MTGPEFGPAWVGAIVLVLVAAYLFFAWKTFKWPFRNK